MLDVTMLDVMHKLYTDSATLYKTRWGFAKGKAIGNIRS